MNTWIGLFRGVNVGGRNILPMKKLKATLEEVGCRGVSTYIQSGNVVFHSDDSNASRMALKIRQSVKSAFGFEPEVLILEPGQLSAAIEANPFPAGEQDPKVLHLFFLAGDADHADWDALDALKSASEEFKLINGVFYLHAPDGIGRSKLAGKVEKYLGVPVTARNWRTVRKVLQLSQ